MNEKLTRVLGKCSFCSGYTAYFKYESRIKEMSCLQPHPMTFILSLCCKPLGGAAAKQRLKWYSGIFSQPKACWVFCKSRLSCTSHQEKSSNLRAVSTTFNHSPLFPSSIVLPTSPAPGSCGHYWCVKDGLEAGVNLTKWRVSEHFLLSPFRTT